MKGAAVSTDGAGRTAMQLDENNINVSGFY